MFTNKKRIGLLEADIKEKKEQIRNLERENRFLKFLIENPPHFKKGDTFGRLKITGYCSDNLRYSVENTGPIKDISKLIIEGYACILNKDYDLDKLNHVFAKEIVSQWAYELTDTVTGEKDIINEYELMLIHQRLNNNAG